jgi:hypothetical protein
MLARGFGETVQHVGRGLIGGESGVQPRMIADDLRVPRLSRLKQPADQHMIETERGGMFELRGPRIQPSDEGGMNKVDPRRISVRSFHRSFPDSSCFAAWMHIRTITTAY